MKFGKAMARQLPRGDAWRPHALAYKQLKRVLKKCVGVSRHQKLTAATLARCHSLLERDARTDAALQASPAEAAFFAVLRAEMKKVNVFFLEEQQACGQRVLQLEAELLELLKDARVDGDDWLQRCGEVYAQLHALELFCVMNFCAVAKILKKHDKWTAFDTRTRFERSVLVKQPFATYVPLLKMMRRVESIAVGMSVLQLTTAPFSLPPLRIEPVEDSGDDDESLTDGEDDSPRSDTSEHHTTSSSYRTNHYRFDAPASEFVRRVPARQMK